MSDDDLLALLDELTDDELERLTKMMNIKEISERINKANAETAKIQQEMRYYPLLTAGGTAIFLFILNFIAKYFGVL